jgi:hypothetical protein
MSITNQGEEVLKCRMPVSLYEAIPQELRQHIAIDNVDVPDYDYTGSEAWVKLKSEAGKMYAKLKELEYEIRHNPKQNDALPY